MPGCGTDSEGNLTARWGPVSCNGITHLYVESEATWFYLHVPSMSSVPYRLRRAFARGMLNRGTRPAEWPRQATLPVECVSGLATVFINYTKRGEGVMMPMPANCSRWRADSIRARFQGSVGKIILATGYLTRWRFVPDEHSRLNPNADIDLTDPAQNPSVY